MFIHIVAFRWKPVATDAQKHQALVELNALRDGIPEILQADIGLNTSVHGMGYSLAAVMRFASRESLQAYAGHQLHRQLVDWLLPLVELVEIDFPA